jgi:hypothetical protein
MRRGYCVVWPSSGAPSLEARMFYFDAVEISAFLEVGWRTGIHLSDRGRR